MRQPAIRFLVVFVTLLFIGLSAPHAFADARGEAKVHYQAGVKAYGSGDYRTAIKEFSTAQQLAPADLNNYNLALCYDKLGEAEPAIQYYREYLSKVPNADKRTEIEASVARLEGALKSAATKRAEEARLADEAKKVEQARRADDARKADEAKKAADAAAANKPDPGPTDPGPTAPDPAVGVGSTGTPGTGQAVSTGDAQLDRVSAIDINAVRAQRMGMGMGTADRGGAPPAGQAGAPNAQAPQGAQGAPQGNAQANAGGTTAAPNGQLAPTDQEPKKPTPVYKKWWFWAVVGISAIVVYQIMTEGSNSATARARDTFAPTPRAASDTGVTLLRF